MNGVTFPRRSGAIAAALIFTVFPVSRIARADTPPPNPNPPTAPTDTRLPGVALAEGVTQITGVAISPLLGVCGVGTWEYFTTDPEKRSELPWFCHPLAWGIGFGILALCLIKDLFGTVLPGILKKPLDVVELFESKVSAIVASAALIPFLDRQIAEVFLLGETAPTAARSALSASGLAAITPALAQSPVWLLALLVPLSFIAFFAVWLSSHALSVLLLLSPFGVLDLVLKAARVLFLAGLVLLSAIAPVLAGILCGLLILAALWFAPRAFRLCLFGSIMSVDLLRSLVRKSDRHERTRAFLARRGSDSLAALSFGRLEPGENGRAVFSSRFLLFGPRRTLILPESVGLELEKGILFPSIRVRNPGTGRAEALLHLLPRHRHDLAHVAEKLGIGKVVDQAIVRGVKAALKRISESVSVKPLTIETGGR